VQRKKKNFKGKRIFSAKVPMMKNVGKDIGIFI